MDATFYIVVMFLVVAGAVGLYTHRGSETKKLRYREAVLAPGEVVAVAGSARLERDPDPTGAGSGYRDGPRRVVLEPLPEGTVFASDEPDNQQ